MKANVNPSSIRRRLLGFGMRIAGLAAVLAVALLAGFEAALEARTGVPWSVMLTELPVFAAAAALGLLSTWVVALRMSDPISGPLMELERIVSEVSRTKDFSLRAGTSGEHGLAQVVQGFNEMLAEVQLRDADLQNAFTEIENRAHELQREIIERERAEKKLSRLTAELERSNRELNNFASVASHDLQEPLRKVRSFGEMLRSHLGGAMDGESTDYLTRMQGAAARMQDLINDLLAYSRVTTKAQPFRAVDLGTVAREVMADLEARVRDTHAVVEIGELPTVEAEPFQMRQLLQNLIGNALKYHKPGQSPTVRVRVDVPNGSSPPARGGGVCRLSVTDDGVGFDQKDAHRLFQMFQRLHSRKDYEGTGIGLAICHKIVERHGGSITAIGRPGEGATFQVILPLQQTIQPGTREEVRA